MGFFNLFSQDPKVIIKNQWINMHKRISITQWHHLIGWIFQLNLRESKFLRQTFLFKSLLGLLKFYFFKCMFYTMQEPSKIFSKILLWEGFFLPNNKKPQNYSPIERQVLLPLYQRFTVSEESCKLMNWYVKSDYWCTKWA